MKTDKFKTASFDPRTGLFLLVLANVIAFRQDCLWMELAWIGMLTVLSMVCGYVCSGLKQMGGFCLLLGLQWYVLPASPKFIATSLAIFANYARRMFPCLIVGSLMLKIISLREMIVGLRKLHVPQKLIISISVTLRYFPAIKEETGHIRDAMQLRNIKGFQKVEAMIVPLMMSAAETAEELSAAAVTRGIENPVKKTSAICLQMKLIDWLILGISVLFTVATFVA